MIFEEISGRKNEKSSFNSAFLGGRNFGGGHKPRASRSRYVISSALKGELTISRKALEYLIEKLNRSRLLTRA